jgi:outer membrane autotransporter protein
MSLTRKLLLTSTALVSMSMANQAFAVDCAAGAGALAASCDVVSTGFSGAKTVADNVVVTVTTATELGDTIDGANPNEGLLVIAKGTEGTPFAIDQIIGGNDALESVTVADGYAASISVDVTAAAISVGDTDGASILNITGGTVTGPVAVLDDSLLNVTGGTVASAITLHPESVLNYDGGAISGTVNGNAHGSGIMNMMATKTTAAIIGGTFRPEEFNVLTDTTTLGAALTADKITVAEGATLTGGAHAISSNGGPITVEGTLTSLGAATVTGAVTVAEGGTFTKATSGNITGAFVNNGTTGITGTSQFSTTVENNGTFTHGGSGTVAGTVLNTGDWTHSSTATISGKVTNSATGEWTHSSTGALTLGMDNAGTATTSSTANIGQHTFTAEAAVLNVSGASTVGAVTASEDGYGTMNVSESITTGSTIGTSPKRVKLIAVNSASGSKTMTLGGNVFADAITVAITDNLGVNSREVTAPITLSGAGATGGEVTITTGTLHDAVNGATDGVGLLTSTNASTWGAVGNLHPLYQVSHTGAGTTATMGGNVSATTAIVDGNATVLNTGANTLTAAVSLTGHNDATLTVGAGGRVVGAITADGNARGILNFTGNGSTSSTIGVTGTRLKAINFNGDEDTLVTLGGDTFAAAVSFTDGGEVDLADHALGVTNNLTITSGILDIDVNDDSPDTVITVGGNVVGTPAQIWITPQGLTASKNVTLISAAGGTDMSAAGFKNKISCMSLYTCADNTSTATLSKVTVAPATGDQVAATLGVTLSPSAKAAIAPLQAMTSSTTRDLLMAADEADTLGTLLEQLAPSPMAVAVSSTQSNVSASAGAVDMAIASLRSPQAGIENGIYGVAAGGNSSSARVWIQPFASNAKQGAKNAIAGFTSKTAGAAVGIDTTLDNNLTLGSAVSFASTNTKGKDAGNSKNKVETISGTLYANYDTPDYFVDLSGVYGHNDYKTSRVVTGLGVGEGDFKGHHVGAELGAGVKIQKEGFRITPKASVSFLSMHTKKYDETGLGVLGMSHASNKRNASTVKALVDIARPISLQSGGALVPSIHVGAGVDLKNDAATSTVAYQGAPANSFKTTGIKPSKSMVLGGANVAYQMNNASSLSVNYEFEGRSKFKSNAGYLRFKLAF